VNSEDNASLETLLETDKKKWNEKYWWLAQQAKDAKEKQLAILDSSANRLNNMVSNFVLFG
jgi:hypothetical protein